MPCFLQQVLAKWKIVLKRTEIEERYWGFKDLCDLF